MADKKLEETKRVMGALLRMPPKQHDDMKVNKGEIPKTARPRRKRIVRKSTS
jgi:hypothetical protein